MSNVNRDAVETTAKEVRTFQGGKLSRLGILDLVELNGTFYEMGLQYGTLMKDKIIAVRDELVKEYVDPEILSYDTMKGVLGEPFYKALPKRTKDLYAGISKATGIDVIEHSTLDQQFMLVLLARRTGQTAMCTALSTWGKNTKDGTSYTGRNFDFAGYIRDMMPKYGQMVIMNPSGGEYSVAGVGLAGMVTEVIDAMNSEGLYYEFNNGAGTIGATIYSNRTPIYSQMFNNLFDFSTIEELKMCLNSYRANYPSLMMTAEPKQGQAFEISTEAYTAPAPEKEDLMCRGNQFIDPSWGIPDLPSPAAWYSRTRRETFTKLVKDAAPNVDAKAMMQILNTEIYDKDNDWKPVDGMTVFENRPKNPADVTVWQVVTHPDERKMWVRIPTYSGWMEFDLKKYFKK